jgi:hypothetical protein
MASLVEYSSETVYGCLELALYPVKETLVELLGFLRSELGLGDRDSSVHLRAC